MEPVGYGICNCIYLPSVMHCESHVGRMAFVLTLSIVPKWSDAYKTFLRHLTQMNQYLDDGSICASTSVLLKSIHELSYYVGRYK